MEFLYEIEEAFRKNRKTLDSILSRVFYSSSHQDDFFKQKNS